MCFAIADHGYKETTKVMRPFGRHRVNYSVLMVMYLLIADSVQVMSSYCDVVVIRHPQPGAVQVRHPCLSTVCLLPGFGQSVSQLVKTTSCKSYFCDLQQCINGK